MMEKWSVEEENAVDEFRKLMKNDVPKHMYEDKYVFYKFLKARNFNMQQAETMLRKHLVWRKEVQIDTIITDFKPSVPLKKFISQSFFGFSKEGYLLQYAAIGNTDGKGLFKCGNSSDVLRCIFQEIEKNIRRLKCQSEKLGRPVNQCIYIYNMENMTLAKATHKSSLELFANGIAMFQDNYPELLKDLYIINASIYFTIAFPIIKAILSGALLNKIHVYGKEGEWKEELLRRIDADVLPAFLGGNRTDPDGNPRCITLLNHGGDIPVDLHLRKDVALLRRKEGCVTVVVERQKNHRVEVEVEGGARLHWEYETARHDIGFGLHLQEEELIPVHKTETENKSEEGFYTCATPGTYTIIFDNTYSWFHAKEVSYRLWVTEPEDKEEFTFINKISCNNH